MIKRLATGIFILSAVAYPSPAVSQTARLCAPHDVLVGQLEQQFSEKPIGRGLTLQGHVMELLTSEDGMTWTVVGRTPQGVSCVLWHGLNWQQIGPESTQIPDGYEL